MEEYNRRAKDVFAALDDLEKEYKEHLNKSELIDIAKDLMKSDCFEEINARKRCRESSDSTDEPCDEQGDKKFFIREKSKWTEYSLADVTEDRMSCEANRKAAHDCLKVLGLVNDCPVQDEGEFDPKSVFGGFAKNKGSKVSEVKKPLVSTGMACRMLTESEEDEGNCMENND